MDCQYYTKLKNIDYFNPKYYFVENPQTGEMKKYMTKPYYDVDYCKYADWGYRKRTRIWTNLQGFNAQLCKRDCNSMDGTKHQVNIGYNDYVKDGDKVISLTTNTLRKKYKDHDRIQEKNQTLTLKDKYRIPPALIKELFESINL